MCGGAGAKEDCCTSPLVDGGEFTLGVDQPVVSTASVASFRLDKYEVTVGRLRKFVGAYERWRADGNPRPGVSAHPRIQASGWNPDWTQYLPTTAAALQESLRCGPFWSWGADDSLPATCLSWFEAFAFCAWDQARLPTEAEWEYAATGGAEQRRYPWGAAPDINMANVTYDCLGDGAAGCTAADVRPVGSKPLGAGRWGQLDLLGGVYEWTRDWYAPYRARCDNCAAVATERTFPIHRGGSWQVEVGYITVTRRDFLTADAEITRFTDLGIRCARDSAPPP